MKSISIFKTVPVFLIGVFLVIGCGESQKKQATRTKIETESGGNTRVVSTKKEIPEDAPRIKVDNPLVNLGNVSPSSKYDCVFTFSNAGKSLLTLKEVEKTCGCQKVTIKDNKMKYEPGETGEITVEYSSSTNPGPVTKHLYIVSDDPVNPKYEITIQAFIEVKVTVTPSRIQLFLTEENAGAVPLKIESKDGKPFAIKNVSVAGGQMTFDFDPDKEATEFTLTPKVDIEKLKKNPSVAIRFTLSHPECKSVSVSCFARPCLSVENQTIYMINTEPGRTTTRNVIIRNDCKEILEIKSIRTDKGYMEVIEQREYEDSVKIVVKATVPPRKADGPMRINDRMTVLFTNGDKAEISLGIWYRAK